MLTFHFFLQVFALFIRSDYMLRELSQSPQKRKKHIATVVYSSKKFLLWSRA